MYINKIEKFNNKKYKIYSDDRFLFALYAGEVKKYGISEGSDIEDVLIEEIYTEVIYTRARERALFLIEKQPYTEYMLRKKLLFNEYPDNIIDSVISFLNRYNYLNDLEYASMYIREYANKKSRKQIVNTLLTKGIDKQIITSAINDIDENNVCSEELCLRYQFDKYIVGKDINDPKMRQKVFRHFYYKGFQVESIKKIMSLEKEY